MDVNPMARIGPEYGRFTGAPVAVAAGEPSVRWAPPEFDSGLPHSARVYDYWLGGKDHFAVDRQLAEMLLEVLPSLREMARENRRFVHRAASFLAARGIDQFIDIGTGIPTSPNLHESVQEVTPSARIVYVDNDPVVLAHARALMLSSTAGAVAYVDGDLRDPRRMLLVPQLGRMIDFDRPVGLTLIAVLMLVSDEEDPHAAMTVLRDALPSGSYLAITHPTGDFDDRAVDAVTSLCVGTQLTIQPRSRAEVARFFGDWELVEPGLVPVMAWRPDEEPVDPRAAYYWAGIARKP